MTLHPHRDPKPRRKADTDLADLRTLLRWTKRGVAAVAAGAVTIIGGIVAVALWVKGVEGQVAKIPAMEAAMSRYERTAEDLVLLQCAQPGLSRTETLICAKYEPRMPR